MPKRHTTYKPCSCATILNLFKWIHSVQCHINESKKCFQYVNVISNLSNNLNFNLLLIQRCCWNTTSTILVIINRICYNTGLLIHFSLHTVYKGIIFGNALTLFSILKSRYKSWKKKVLIIIVKTPTLFEDNVEKEQFILFHPHHSNLHHRKYD